MRLYGRKFIRAGIINTAEQRVETRDAVLWDILPAQRVCRVKIQGSNQLITAFFPENFELIPQYMKPGNAVRITHVGGVRGRIEVTGHGRNIPTPVAGGMLPPPALGVDAVINGCSLAPTIPTSMAVTIRPGTYRISGVQYTLYGDPALSDTGGDIIPEEGGALIGQSALTIAVDAPPGTPGYFRYDIVTVGEYGELAYTKGTESMWPVVPTTPPQHVLLGTILLSYGMEEITWHDLNRQHIAPVPTLLRVVADPSVLYRYGPEYTGDMQPVYTTSTVVVTVLDQYEQPVFAPGNGWRVTLQIVKGTGSIGVSAKYTGADANYATWTYTRASSGTGEASVHLRATLYGNNTLEGFGYIFLFTDGDILP